jgi:SAM-dependent methyltransferase
MMERYQIPVHNLGQAWKIPHMVKGALTWLPIFNELRLRRASTGGTDSARYCYSVWLRHLVSLHRYGFRVDNAHVGELGPGDSIGIGLGALLSGAAEYVGLDIVPFSTKANLESIFDELVQLYLRRESIPDSNDFPFVRPGLGSYEFPADLVEMVDFAARSEKIRTELKLGLNQSQLLKYKAPWISSGVVTTNSLDLIFSQAVLEHVDELENTYQAMYAWLKPDAFASHVIDFSSHHLSPFWNGHWAYSDWQWKLVRGCREFLLNREPLSTHLRCAGKAGFRILNIAVLDGDNGLKHNYLSERFQSLDGNDTHASGVYLILQKH